MIKERQYAVHTRDGIFTCDDYVVACNVAGAYGSCDVDQVQRGRVAATYAQASGTGWTRDRVPPVEVVEDVPAQLTARQIRQTRIAAGTLRVVGSDTLAKVRRDSPHLTGMGLLMEVCNRLGNTL